MALGVVICEGLGCFKRWDFTDSMCIPTGPPCSSVHVISESVLNGLVNQDSDAVVKAVCGFVFYQTEPNRLFDTLEELRDGPGYRCAARNDSGGNILPG